jgi:hypothetical protein
MIADQNGDLLLARLRIRMNGARIASEAVGVTIARWQTAGNVRFVPRAD